MDNHNHHVVQIRQNLVYMSVLSTPIRLGFLEWKDMLMDFSLNLRKRNLNRS